jgi:hypothetical protein
VSPSSSGRISSSHSSTKAGVPLEEVVFNRKPSRADDGL